MDDVAALIRHTPWQQVAPHVRTMLLPRCMELGVWPPFPDGDLKRHLARYRDIALPDFERAYATLVRYAGHGTESAPTRVPPPASLSVNAAAASTTAATCTPPSVATGQVACLGAAAAAAAAATCEPSSATQATEKDEEEEEEGEEEGEQVGHNERIRHDAEADDGDYGWNQFVAFILPFEDYNGHGNDDASDGESHDGSGQADGTGQVEPHNQNGPQHGACYLDTEPLPCVITGRWSVADGASGQGDAIVLSDNAVVHAPCAHTASPLCQYQITGCSTAAGADPNHGGVASDNACHHTRDGDSDTPRVQPRPMQQEFRARLPGMVYRPPPVLDIVNVATGQQAEKIMYAPWGWWMDVKISPHALAKCTHGKLAAALLWEITLSGMSEPEMYWRAQQLADDVLHSPPTSPPGSPSIVLPL